MSTANPPRWNGARYAPGMTTGHYDSWVPARQRCERAARVLDPLTRSSRRGTAGRLRWASCGRSSSRVRARGSSRSSRSTRFNRRARFARDRLEVRNRRWRGSRMGRCAARRDSHGHTIAWDLRYAGGQPPLLLLPGAVVTARGCRRPSRWSASPLARFTRHADGRWRGPHDRGLGRQPEPQLGQPAHRFATPGARSPGSTRRRRRSSSARRRGSRSARC